MGGNLIYRFYSTYIYLFGKKRHSLKFHDSRSLFSNNDLLCYLIYVILHEYFTAMVEFCHVRFQIDCAVVGSDGYCTRWLVFFCGAAHSWNWSAESANMWLGSSIRQPPVTWTSWGIFSPLKWTRLSGEWEMAITCLQGM